MTKILCAIRGGESSQRIQDIGIKLAKERGEEIVRGERRMIRGKPIPIRLNPERDRSGRAVKTLLPGIGQQG